MGRSRSPRCAWSADLLFGIARDPSDADDRSLVAAAQAGDRDALETLLRRHHDRLWALCRRLTGNHADAEDALQDALIAIARHQPVRRPRRVHDVVVPRATNACLDELRRRRRRPIPDASEILGAPSPDGPGGASPLWPGRSRGRRRPPGHRRGLALLPQEFRAAVVLPRPVRPRRRDRRVLGIRPARSGSRIARGRSQLADLLGNLTDEQNRPSTRS